jgi:hypothetical protein
VVMVMVVLAMVVMAMAMVVMVMVVKRIGTQYPNLNLIGCSRGCLAELTSEASGGTTMILVENVDADDYMSVNIGRMS